MSSPTPGASPPGGGAAVAVGALVIGAAAAFGHGRLWLPAAAVLVAAWTAVLARMAVHPARAGSGRPAAAPTYAIWGRWESRPWARFREGLGRALAEAGFQPARRRAAPDILICGPGAPRLAGWTPRRVAGFVVGVLPQPAGSGEPARRAAGLLRHRSWDAVAYVGLDGARPTAALVDARGDETTVAGRADDAAFVRALVRLLVAQAHGGHAGAAGF